MSDDGSDLRRWLEQKLNSLLRRVGYRLGRRAETPSGRTVVNAYYRGHHFRCFRGDSVSECILTGEGWDIQLQEVLDELEVEDGSEVIEIGANIGASLVPIAANFPQLNFHCIEPVPEFFDLLKLNAASFGADNVQIYQCAIGNDAGEDVKIHVGYGTAGLSSQVYHTANMGTLHLPSQTLDSFAGEDRVALLKIDVDGHELNVLRGASQLLRRDHPRIFMEYSPSYMSDPGGDAAKFRDLLHGAGYEHAKVWSNVGTLLAEEATWSEIHRLASDRTSDYQYLDILLRAEG